MDARTVSQWTKKLGVKSLHAVPIVVDGKCWGVVVLDDCRGKTPQCRRTRCVENSRRFYQQRHQTRSHPSCREEAELMVLLERRKAASERTAELAKANEAAV